VETVSVQEAKKRLTRKKKLVAYFIYNHGIASNQRLAGEDEANIEKITLKPKAILTRD
jgi:hypothetical protein